MFKLILIIVLFTHYFSNTLLAHAILEYSEPARRSVLYRPPDQIVLTFNEAIETTFAKIKLLNEKNKTIITKEKPKNKNNKKSIFIPLLNLQKGIYFVEYDVISVDGHRVRGRYKFTIKDSN